jgi:hypothetical protein
MYAEMMGDQSLAASAYVKIKEYEDAIKQWEEVKHE